MTYDGFADWADVQSQFSMNDPEPQAVIWAEYDNDGYDGRAWVLYYDKGKFFYVEGGHCSCYGLEDQWNPEEYSVEALKGQVERATYGFFKDRKDIIMAAIEKYQSPLAELALELSSLEAKIADAGARFDAADAELRYFKPQLEQVKARMRALLN